jgi:hypothetical protein
MREVEMRLRFWGNRALFASALMMALTAAACGSRGPLDVDVVQPVASPSNDAGSNNPINVVDASGPENPAPVDSGPQGQADARALVEAGLLTCGTCVAQQCGTQIFTCIQDTTCRTELQCIATTCLAGDAGGGGGTGNLGCFTKCAGGVAGLATLLPIITCITQQCGPDCGGALGGVPGLGGMPIEVPEASGPEMFSRFPELFTAR